MGGEPREDGAVSVLLRAYPFQDLTAGDLAPLIPHLNRHTFDAGEYVWHQGDPASHFWFVIRGAVHSLHASPDGEEVITQVAAAGESFGQPALFLPDGRRVVSVVAMVATELWSLAKEPLLDFLAAHPAAMRRMLESMSKLVLSQSLLFGQMAFDDVRTRVAYQILKLADEYGEKRDDGVWIPFRLSQTTLAALVAATRESTNRALKALVTSGMVAQRKGHLVVVNHENLRQMLVSRDSAP
jgi:CRP/FNR family transcriptional regulator, cyclic AMP receptor protein